MSKLRSRLSSDDGRTVRTPPTSSICEKSPCPSCGHPRLTTVDVDDELRVIICDGCKRGYGIDDSMDVEAVAALLIDEEFRRDVQMTAVTCRRCSNNDLDRFVVVEQNPDRQVIRIRCEGCCSVSDVALKDWSMDGSGNGDDKWMAEGRDEDDSGLLWSGDDRGYTVDSVDIDARLDVLPFSCGCGNNEVDCFEKHFDPASGDLSKVKCLVCDREKLLDAFFGVECWHCRNDTKQLFERCADDYGRITKLRCLACDRRLYCPGQPPPRKGRMKKDHSDKVPPMDRKSGHKTAKAGSVDGLGWTKIADLRHVQRGDHVAWHKWYAIWHHAIVVDVPDGGRALTVIHNSGDVFKLDGHFASVRLETLDVNPKKEDFYRISYPQVDIHPVDEVLQRAGSRIGEAKYNPLTNNCEHFARWCKTGCAQSGQVRKFTDRLSLTGRSAVVKAAVEGAADGVESLVAGSLSTAGRLGGSISQRAGQVFGATSGVVRNVKCGALACNVLINTALEAGLFTKDVVRAYRKYKSGDITRDEFHRILSKSGCESVGGLIGGSAAGIIGQVLVPIPFLGGTVGCTLGSLIGRYIGAIIGKQLGAIKH